MKRIFVTLILSIFICNFLFARGGARDSLASESKAAQFFVRTKLKVDAIIDKYQTSHTDTNYICRPKTHWTFQLFGDIYGHDIGFFQGDNNYELSSLCKSSIGISAAYRGLSVSVTLDLLKKIKKKTDIEYNINYYGSWFGVDLQLSRISSFNERYGEARGINKNAMLRNISLNGYYLFNYKKFTYSAMFDQTWLQKRSAGSPLLSVTGYLSSSQIGTPPNVEPMRSLQLDHLNLAFVALGAGYAYNFVPRGRHWLIHISLEPSMTIWKRTRAYLDDERYVSSPRPYNFYMTGRTGATYFLNKFFIGLNGVTQIYDAGQIKSIHIQHTKFKASAFVGVRF